jgi:hypothetical protein
VGAAEASAAADEGGEPDRDGLAWKASSLEAASMLRMCRASGSRARAAIRGSNTGSASGRSKSVAVRRNSRRRPSGKATAT